MSAFGPSALMPKRTFFTELWLAMQWSPRTLMPLLVLSIQSFSVNAETSETLNTSQFLTVTFELDLPIATMSPPVLGVGAYDGLTENPPTTKPWALLIAICET